MSRNEIIRMAREAGMQGMLTDVVCTFSELERFAALVAAAEREACAKVCDEQAESHELLSNTQAVKGCDDCAAAIRARGSNVA